METRVLRSRATALSYVFLAACLSYLTVRWFIMLVTPSQLPQFGQPLPPMVRTLDRWFTVVTTLVSVGFLLLPLAGVALCLAAARARVVLTRDELRIVNPLSGHRLSWSEVVRVELEQSGLVHWRTFVHTTRGTIQAWGIRSSTLRPLPLVFAFLSRDDSNPFSARDSDRRPRYIADPFEELEREYVTAHQRLNSFGSD